MKHFYLFIFLMLSLVVTGQSKRNGHEYHVAVTGSDSGNGTTARPFKTIQAAADVAMPGDTITVHQGVYREQVVPPRGGNSENERIVFRAAHGERVEIKGSEIIKNWQKSENDTWRVEIPNSFFGEFNPYKECISGDWFRQEPKDRKYRRGEVYLNGHWLVESATKEDVMTPVNNGKCLWWAEVDTTTTIIWAQFPNHDPNNEVVEINVRQTVFYPDKPFINFIGLQGFIMQHAATNWAPPTAEQVGLVGTHWSKGWVIENNTIQYSKCVGITLGKYGDQFDNKDTESAEGYIGTINRALAFGWNKGTIGSHIIRNNTISHCEQAGIVGSMGCAFSIIENNTIHDIHVRRLFGGAEMAGIKFHGAVDVQIRNNYIYRTNMGVWLDWMAQGAQIAGNLMHDNSPDIFLEVNHGPTLVFNNILLSGKNLLMNSSGAAFTHNIFMGKVDVIDYDARLTPYHRPHSTFVEGLHDNPGGDIQFINNLFLEGSDVSQYSSALLPVVFEGNVYTRGTIKIAGNKEQKKFGEMNENAQEQMKQYKNNPSVERKATDDLNFDPLCNLVREKEGIYLEMMVSEKWFNQKRRLVTSDILTPSAITQLPYCQVGGGPIQIDNDYFGKKRNLSNPFPGPIEIVKSGKYRWKVH
jgi:alpha-N-arabinofuranosidase